MRIIRPSSEDEMVLTFLRAEAAALGEMGYTRALIDNPDLDSASENQARAQCLSAWRGFKLNAFLFRGFPDNVSWNRVLLSIEELARAKFIKQDVWEKASGGTRLVSDGAKNLDGDDFPEDIRSRIKGIEAEVRQGRRFPELIVVGESEGSSLILVEGHKRAIAYVRAAECLPEVVEAIAGFSTDLNSWRWY